MRVLEDVGSAVALLVGELSRKTQRITRADAEASHLRNELQGVRENLTQRDSRYLRSLTWVFAFHVIHPFSILLGTIHDFYC